MLAELAAANAAFGIIKQAISNGKEIGSVATQIATFISSQDDLRRKAEKKKKLGSYRAPISGRKILEEFKPDIVHFGHLNHLSLIPPLS